MPRDNLTCVICKKRGWKGIWNIPNGPNNLGTRQKWLKVIRESFNDEESEKDVAKSARVCYRHFLESEIEVLPNLTRPKAGKN